jgi:hypothetical protein
VEDWAETGWIITSASEARKVNSDAAKAINVDFAWAPWFAFANDNYNKHIAELLSGSTTVKQALDGWQNDCLKNGKDAGYEVKGQ